MIKDKNKKIAVFTIGIPASGKSTYARNHYKGYAILDCDKIKETLPGYNPKEPGVYHKLSKDILEGIFSQTLIAGNSFVYDSTGTNTEKLLYNIGKARQAGYKTSLVYVKISLDKAIKRNAKRARTVPEYIIKEKYKYIEYAFKAVKTFVDSYKIVSGG